jgi:hypothetical protein
MAALSSTVKQGAQGSADGKAAATYFNGHMEEMNQITFLMQYTELITFFNTKQH